MALSSYPPPYGRRRVKLFALALGLLLLLALVPLAWLFGTARGQAVWEQANSRSPNELIRYTERRLQGHPRLERWLLPPLHALRARVLVVNPDATALDGVATRCLRATAAVALPALLGDA